MIFPQTKNFFYENGLKTLLDEKFMSCNFLCKFS
jgi:hypothetical protein